MPIFGRASVRDLRSLIDLSVYRQRIVPKVYYLFILFFPLLLYLLLKLLDSLLITVDHFFDQFIFFLKLFDEFPVFRFCSFQFAYLDRPRE